MKPIPALMLLVSAIVIAGGAGAQTNYPDKPLHLVVGFPPGSQPDTVARLLGQKLSEALGKPVLIDAVSGAAGNIAAERLAKAAPDGYTLGLFARRRAEAQKRMACDLHSRVRFVPAKVKLLLY
jgi:tripartite-type tricarboxylate transporter receptor subunit TctC